MGKDAERALAFAREASLGSPGSIKDIADYLLNEGTGIASLTMAKIAACVYTSKPTMVRFAKLAGYPGWNAYRRDFLECMREMEQEQIASFDIDLNYPFDESTPTAQMVDALARIYELAVNQVKTDIDPRVLEAAAAMICSARQLVFLASVQNRERGLLFASNLNIIGRLTLVPEATYAGLFVSLLRPGDCVLATSYSGDLAHPPFNFVPELKDRGVNVVAVTNSLRSPLGSLATHTLGFAPLEHLREKTGPFYSGTCTSLILDMLYAVCYRQQFRSSADNQGRLKEMFGDSFPNDI